MLHVVEDSSWALCLKQPPLPPGCLQAVTKAYEILSDPSLRRVYDSYGAKGVKTVLRGDPLPELRARKRWAGEASRGEDVR